MEQRSEHKIGYLPGKILENMLETQASEYEVTYMHIKCNTGPRGLIQDENFGT